MFQIVFNLYPVTGQILLPNAFIVKVDKDGGLSHVMQKANPSTLNAYQLESNTQWEHLFRITESLSPKSLETKFKPPKARLPIPLQQLLADSTTKPLVENYIHKELAVFLSEIQVNRLPITLDVEKRTLAKDVLINLNSEELTPHLYFQKTTEGVLYKLQLGTENEKWNIQDSHILPLTNTDPAWLLLGHNLHRVPGINGNMVKPFQQKDTVVIPPKQVITYFKQFIAKKAGKIQIQAEGFGMETNTELVRVSLQPTEHILEKKWMLLPTFEYDDAKFVMGDKREMVTTVQISESEEVVVRKTCRNQAKEKQCQDFIAALGLVADGRSFRLPESKTDNPADSLENLIQWLATNQDDLKRHGIETACPTIEGKTLAIQTCQLTLQSQASADWFDIQGEIVTEKFNIPFRQIIPNIRRKDPLFKLPDNTWLLIPETWMTRYADLAISAEETQHNLRLPKSLYTILQDTGLSEQLNDTPWPEINPEQIEFHLPKDLQATLRPYQLTGVKWLVGHYRHGFGACLADDMGLGKTLQTITLLLHAKENKKKSETPTTQGPQMDLFKSYQAELQPLQALIILPASLVFNWQKELAKFAPNLFVYAHTGNKRIRDSRLISSYDIILTTYHTARLDLELLQKLHWHFIILDESQQIKNRESEVSKVVLTLQSDHKISLSGTPIENSLADLWTQMEFINPATLGSFRQFKEHFLYPIQKNKDETARTRLFVRVRPFFLRRTKEEVAPDLPALTEQIFFSEMTIQQEKKYEQLKSAVRNEILSLFDNPKTRIQALAALTKLRQIANHPVLADENYEGNSGKFDDVLSYWLTIQKAGHKVLFFSSFEKHLRLFRKQFEQDNLPFAWLTGATKPEERTLEIQKFQENPSVQAFFITLKAGGIGLNLTAADYVFVLDPWWNPAVEAQAVARAHRIGQNKPVAAIRFIARNTIEEKIRLLQEEKRSLGNDLFLTGEDTPSLSRTDLELLLT
jgi:non-specific serine/threonine protein kinase